MIITASQDRIAVTAAWKNIAAENVALVNVNVLIQNLDDDIVEVVAGGASAPTTKGPVRLDTGEVIEVNAAQVWVRGEGNISATLAA